MKRKVIQIANSTQLISLPRKWAKLHGVNKGDELEISQVGNHLLVLPPDFNQVDAAKISLNLTALDRSSIMFTIRALYRKGYDDIELLFENPTTNHLRINKELKVLSVIHEEINRLIGVELIQQRERSCIIKSVSEVSTKDFDTLMRRIFLLLEDASSDLLTAAKKDDRVLMETIEEKHNTVTKFISYCLRLINKRGHPDLQYPCIYYHILASLDKIMDAIKYASRDFMGLNKPISENTIKITESIHKSLLWYHQFFYKFDLNHVANLYQNRDEVARLIRDGEVRYEELTPVNELASILELLVDLTEARISVEHYS